MKRQLLQFVTVGALAAGMALAQNASPSPAPNAPARHQFVRRHMQRVSQALGLTDAQKAQAKTIFQGARETAKPIRDLLKTNRQALATAVKAGNSDAQIQQLSSQRGVLLGQLSTVRAEAASKFYAMLTPDQRAKADQMHQQFRQRMQNRRNNG